jgi:hypothetical protein
VFYESLRACMLNMFFTHEVPQSHSVSCLGTTLKVEFELSR